MAAILGIKNYHDENTEFILKNWGVLLLSDEKELKSNNALKRSLKELVALKDTGSEEAYNRLLQKTPALANFINSLLKKFVVD